MKIDFDTLAPESRRIILVCSDDRYRELVAQIDWMKVLKLCATPLAFYALPSTSLVAAVVGPSAARSAYLAATWAAAAAPAGDQSWFDRMTRRGEIPIPHLAPIEATRRFKFDIGEPKDGNAYLLDPCVADHYLVPAIANERLAQDKVAAFTQIAAALGAKRIEILSAEMRQTGATGSANAPIGDAAVQVGIGAAVDGQHGVQRQVFMEFDDPDRAPFVPPELSRWAEMDPSLRALINTRLTARARSAKVILTFEDTLEVDAKVTAELADRKIGVGGSYRQVRASTWSFAVEFWPAPRSG